MKDVVIVDCIRTPMGRFMGGAFRNVRRRLVRAPDEIHPAAQPQPRPERDRGYPLGLRAADPQQGFNIAATPPCWPAFPSRWGQSPSTACAAPACRRCMMPPAPFR